MGWTKNPAPTPKIALTTKRARPKYAVKEREDIISLDFETYYDDDYTLRKLSYSEYIRDPRFEVIMCGVKVGTGPTIVHDDKGLRAKLKKIDWTKHDLLCHNTPFDGFILSHHYGVIPRRYLDTLAMARGLHGNDISGNLDAVSVYYGGKGKIKGALEDVKGMHTDEIRYGKNSGKRETTLWQKMVDYCARDVDEMYHIYYQMLAKLPPLELTKIDIFVRAFCEPVLRVDRERVLKEQAREIESKEKALLTAVGSKAEQTKLIRLLGRQGALDYARKEIGSSPRFAELLRALSIDPPMKPGKNGDIYAFSKTDEDFLALLEHPNQQVRDLCEARLEVKSTGNITKAGRFLKASENGARLPVLLNYYAAHTGRPGGGNKMNMLNLERGGELRRSMLAPKGMKIIVADSGQIEARVAMWISDQLDALEEFRRGDLKLDRDPYCIFADDVYGYRIEKDKHPNERHVGKVSKLSLQYQAGPPRFQTMLSLGALGGKPMFIELGEAQRIVSLFRRRHDKLVRFWDMCQKVIIPDMARGREGEWKCIHWERERIWLPNDMCLKYPEIREHRHEQGTDWTYMRKGKPSKIYGGLLTENIVQALANVIVTEQMVKIAEKYRIVTMTYDENVWIAPAKEAKKAFECGLDIMKTSPTWAPDLPLFAEGGFDDNYSK